MVEGKQRDVDFTNQQMQPSRNIYKVVNVIIGNGGSSISTSNQRGNIPILVPFTLDMYIVHGKDFEDEIQNIRG
jgi:hypothetical protein